MARSGDHFLLKLCERREESIIASRNYKDCWNKKEKFHFEEYEEVLNQTYKINLSVETEDIQRDEQEATL